MKTGAVGSGARGMDVRRQGGDPPSGWMEVLVEESQTTTTTSSSAIPNLPLSNNRQRLAGQAVLLLLLRDGDGADADSFFSGSIPNALAVGQARHRPAAAPPWPTLAARRSARHELASSLPQGVPR